MFKIVCLLTVVGVAMAHEKHFGYDIKIKHDGHYGGHFDSNIKHGAGEISAKHYGGDNSGKGYELHDYHVNNKNILINKFW